MSQLASKVQHGRIQQRVDTKEAWKEHNPVLLEREIGYEQETGQYKIGDGNTKWNDLGYKGSVYNIYKEMDLPEELTNGYVYFTSDTHNFYIDHLDEQNNLTRSLIGVGKRIDTNNEIFNDYDNNQVFGRKSVSFGEKTIGGTKGYDINNILHLSDNKYQIYFPGAISPEDFGYESGDIISCVGADYYLNCWKITDVCAEPDSENEHTYIHSITVALVSNQQPALSDSSSYYKNYICCLSKPHIGNKEFGDCSFAQGRETVAAGRFSHTEGYNTKALTYGHAEGNSCIAGASAHAEGQATIALGNQSHAEGFHTNATGLNSHSEGYYTTSSGTNSHTEGSSTEATSTCAHSEGYATKAFGECSHAEGSNSIASGKSSHAEGQNNQANGIGSHSEGQHNKILEDAEGSHVEGHYNTVKGRYAHVEGYGNTIPVSVSYAHVEGREHTINTNTDANGKITSPSGIHAEGYKNTIGYKASNSHIEGYLCTATGEIVHVEGYGSTAEGNYSHAEGRNTLSKGAYSHAEGREAKAVGATSHAEGHGTIANGKVQHAQGKWNIAMGENYAHVVGNGDGEDIVDGNGKIIEKHRSNAHTLDWNGNAWFAGNVTIGADNKVLLTSDLSNVDDNAFLQKILAVLPNGDEVNY